MSAPATVLINRSALEAIIEQLIELLDTADSNATIEVEEAG